VAQQKKVMAADPSCYHDLYPETGIGIPALPIPGTSSARKLPLQPILRAMLNWLTENNLRRAQATSIHRVPWQAAPVAKSLTAYGAIIGAIGIADTGANVPL
jgi:hypothetical protein